MRHREDPLDYVEEMNTIMQLKKASYEPFWTAFIANLAIKLFGIKISGKLNRRVYSSTTLCFSNLPEPQEEVPFFGYEVSYLAPTCYGLPIEILIHVFSYVDKVTFVVSANENTIPDPEKLCDDLQHSFHLIKTSFLSRGFAKN
ncbi:O-acyltransferase, WSD1 domain-containing protein [Artemisia annua]|uniref:O-acyltransferase, WSD1 domain-containing protein n=1 Tax=Artemisia annua TaxID=35608 RepID=A0A2U1P8Q2_ARTAN|nr:O-acyltransferase, WSD1 domain-containing protein [Artemisia annua]